MTHPVDTEALDDEARLLKRILWLNVRAFGLGTGLLAALAVFAATNWLVIKGGDPVGPHLQLLGQYFIGYRVTFGGSLIGAAYGFGVGAAAGGVLAYVYNRVAERRHPDEAPPGP